MGGGIVVGPTGLPESGGGGGGESDPLYDEAVEDGSPRAGVPSISRRAAPV
jgi:S-DNA-T family DNA segregation ATPase FtsK/SpoIIIE